MPDYGQMGFGSPSSYGFDVPDPAAGPSASPQPGVSTSPRGRTARANATPSGRLTRGQMSELRAAQKRRTQQSVQARSDTVNTMRDLQEASPQNKAEKWTGALASVPAAYRPFVDDLTLNCMGSEGAIANAENYMEGLIDLTLSRHPDIFPGGKGDWGNDPENRRRVAGLDEYLIQFGPAAAQVQKCGELMLALTVAAGRTDKIAPAAYQHIQDVLRHYTVTRDGVIINVRVEPIIPPMPGPGPVPHPGPEEPSGSAAPPSPEDQLNPPQHQQAGAMDPASSAPVEQDTVLFEASTPADTLFVEQDTTIQLPDVVIPAETKRGFRALMDQKWFPYAAADSESLS